MTCGWPPTSSPSLSQDLATATAGGLGRLLGLGVAIGAGVLLATDAPAPATNGHGLHSRAMTDEAVTDRFGPTDEVLSGQTADVYFERAQAILRAEHLDPVVVMEVFSRDAGILCGAAEVHAFLGKVLGPGNGHDPLPVVESLSDGDLFESKEVVMRIEARYSAFGLYETAVLGTLAQCSGWATAARQIVDAAAPIPVIGFGARHVHPSVADQMDYASVVGGCIGASTPAGARMAGLSPTGTMPHALVLIFGDTVRAAEAFDRHIDPDVPRIVLVDTFKDEAEEALRVADALGDRLWGVRLDTPVRARTGHAGPGEGGSSPAGHGRATAT